MSVPTALLLPIADGVNTGSFALAGSSPKATYWESLNVHNTSVDVVQISVAGSFTCLLQPLPAALSVMAVTVQMSVVDDLVGGGQVRGFLEYGGVRYYGASGGWYTLPDTNYHTVDTEIVGAFSPAQMRNMRIGWESDTPAPGGRHSVSYLNASAPYVPEPPDVDSARDIASRRVWIRRRGDRRITIVGGVALLDYRPGSRIDLSHLAGIHAAGQGWANTVDERRPLWVESGPHWDPTTKQITLVCIDHRSKLCLLYDSGWAKVSGVSRDGLMYMSPGALRTMSRASEAECEDASGQLVSVPDDVEAFAGRGQVIQSARTNLLLNSAFALGVDVNWTSSGEGSNGSNISAETATGHWTVDLSAQCLKILAGSPLHAADLQHAAAATTGIADDVTVSVYHQDSGGALSIAVQRSTDSNWYRASDATWQAGKTWNLLTQRAAWARDSIAMDVGSLAQLSVFVGVPTSTGVAGQNHLVSHVQVEAGTYAMSPIFTLQTLVARAADDLQIENNVGERTLSAGQFTVMVEAEPFWSPSDLANSTAKNLWYAYHDSNNHLLVRYYKTSAGVSEWQAILTSAGVAYTAIASAPPSRGTRQTITVRFTGERGELGKAPYTLEILVDAGGSTTTAIAAQPMIEAATSYIQFAGWDGYIRQRFSSPQVLTDTEIVRGI